MKQFIRARAPLRLSFSGGGTDVSPYPEERGGVVLSTTIDKFCYATVRPRRDSRLTLHSLDLHLRAKYGHLRAVRLDGNLDLVKAAVKALKPRSGADVTVQSDAPPGSGLGASSTMVVTLLAALREWLHEPLTDYELAEAAYALERHDLGIAGGRQDQYAATFGGFNFIEFHGDATVVNPLRVREDVRLELEYRLLLCYVGRTRFSGHIIERQTAAYQSGREATVNALDGLKAITYDMKNALLRGKIDDMGALLDTAWQHKRDLEEHISTAEVDDLYARARKAGALGGKMPGAGGGGYFFFLCAPDKKPQVAEVVRAWGAQLVPVSFCPTGVTAWQTTGR
ncbi:MAG TPA: GHMP kinase [Candidatus Eisenbacteria bacterium]|nr:GHMP kinase [Candidatus Eisenbacteria bacterium]